MFEGNENPSIASFDYELPGRFDRERALKVTQRVPATSIRNASPADIALRLVDHALNRLPDGRLIAIEAIKENGNRKPELSNFWR